MNPFIAFFKDLLRLGLESFGRYYSSYVGIVSSNEDPEQLSRLQLVIPIITGGKVLEIWAFPRNVYAGKNYGMQILPQRGDIVRVEFESGDPKAPIWSFSHFARYEKPDEEELKDVKSFWFITPGGHRVVINDTKNYIHIEDSQENKVTIDEVGITLQVKDGNKINLGNPITDKAVLGDKLHDVLKELVETLQSATTSAGPFLPPTQLKLLTIKAELETILSNTVNLK